MQDITFQSMLNITITYSFKKGAKSKYSITDTIKTTIATENNIYSTVSPTKIWISEHSKDTFYTIKNPLSCIKKIIT